MRPKAGLTAGPPRRRIAAAPGARRLLAWPSTRAPQRRRQRMVAFVTSAQFSARGVSPFIQKTGGKAVPPRNTGLVAPTINTPGVPAPAPFAPEIRGGVGGAIARVPPPIRVLDAGGEEPIGARKVGVEGPMGAYDPPLIGRPFVPAKGDGKVGAARKTFAVATVT